MDAILLWTVRRLWTPPGRPDSGRLWHSGRYEWSGRYDHSGRL